MCLKPSEMRVPVCSVQAASKFNLRGKTTMVDAMDQTAGAVNSVARVLNHNSRVLQSSCIASADHSPAPDLEHKQSLSPDS